VVSGQLVQLAETTEVGDAALRNLAGQVAVATREQSRFAVASDRVSTALPLQEQQARNLALIEARVAQIRRAEADRVITKTAAEQLVAEQERRRAALLGVQNRVSTQNIVSEERLVAQCLSSSMF